MGGHGWTVGPPSVRQVQPPAGLWGWLGPRLAPPAWGVGCRAAPHARPPLGAPRRSCPLPYGDGQAGRVHPDGRCAQLGADDRTPHWRGLQQVLPGRWQGVPPGRVDDGLRLECPPGLARGVRPSAKGCWVGSALYTAAALQMAADCGVQLTQWTAAIGGTTKQGAVGNVIEAYATLLVKDRAWGELSSIMYYLARHDDGGLSR